MVSPVCLMCGSDVSLRILLCLVADEDVKKPNKQTAQTASDKKPNWIEQPCWLSRLSALLSVSILTLLGQIYFSGMGADFGKKPSNLCCDTKDFTSSPSYFNQVACNHM